MHVSHLLGCLARYRDNGTPPRKRKKNAELDQYMGHLHMFTMRRVEAGNPRRLSLQKLADEIEEEHGRRFHRSAVMRALIRHNLYELWG